MNPLEQLQDITLPEPVSHFPWAWGWWALFALALILLAGLGYWLKQRQQQRRFSNLAAIQLARFDANDPQFSQQVSELIKQTFAAYGQRQRCASLAGTQWHQLLNQYHKADWQHLLGNPYQASCSHGGEQLRQAALQVIKRISSEAQSA